MSKITDYIDHRPVTATNSAPAAVAIDAVLRTARAMRSGAEIESSDLDVASENWEPGDLYGAMLEAERWAAAAKVVAGHLAEVMLTDVAAVGPIRLGEEVFATKTGDRKLLPDADPLSWLGDIDAIRAAVSITERSLRITVMRKIAEERGLEPSIVDDTFFERRTDVEGEPILKLTRLPVGGRNTPNYLSALRPDERLVRGEKPPRVKRPKLAEARGDQLKRACRGLGLPVSGTVAVLRGRLEAADVETVKP